MCWGYIQRHEVFNERRRIDTSGRITDDVIAPADCEGLHLRGFWTQFPFGSVILWGWDDRLHLAIDGHALMLMREVSIEWKFKEPHCHARIGWRGGVTDFKYINDEILFRYKIRDYDFTAISSAHDFDLLLFAHDVLKDDAWHRRCERSWGRKVPEISLE